MSEKKPFFGSAASKWLIAGAAILTIGVGAGVADWARRGDGGYGWHGRGMGPRGAGIQRLCERDPLRFEGVARAYIKADLDLNAQQNAELDKLANGLVPALKDLRDAVCNDFANAGMNAPAPERLEKFAVLLRKAADTAEKTVAPAKSFYATLDDKQKARVEELTRKRHRMMGPQGPGRFDGPGGPEGGPGAGPGWRYR
jgi:hypothetical protein